MRRFVSADVANRNALIIQHVSRLSIVRRRTFFHFHYDRIFSFSFKKYRFANFFPELDDGFDPVHVWFPCGFERCNITLGNAWRGPASPTIIRVAPDTADLTRRTTKFLAFEVLRRSFLCFDFLYAALFLHVPRCLGSPALWICFHILTIPHVSSVASRVKSDLVNPIPKKVYL